MTSSASAMEIWQGIVQTKEISEYFRDTFVKAGIHVTDTGERFTVLHDGERISFAPGIANDVDFTIPIVAQNIHNLVNHTREGRIDPHESWRIVQVLFTPMTEATLKAPIFSNRLLLRLAGVEDHVHVHLLSPDGSDAATHTLRFMDGRWHVSAGLEGQAARTYRLKPDQAMDYHRRIMRVLRAKSLFRWLGFASWYRSWRETVSSVQA